MNPRGPYREGPERKYSPTCEMCARDAVYWTNLIQDDDGMWICSDCRMRSLEQKKAWPGQKCDVPGCTKTAKEHIEEFRQIVNSGKWAVRFASKRKPTPPDEELPF